MGDFAEARRCATGVKQEVRIPAGQPGQKPTRSIERTGLGRTLSALFALMALLVVGTIVANYFTGYVASRLSQRTMRTHDLIDELRDCASILKDAETGQRGYLLTGDAKYLVPYQDALAAIEKNFTVLQGYVDQGRVKPQDLARLRQLTRAKLDELARTIDLEQTQHAEAAVAMVRTDAGILAMNAIRQHVDQMIAELNADLTTEQRTAERMEWLRMATIIATTALNLAFLGWACGRLKREIAAREASTLEVHRQKDLLAVTLASIGDAVIVTNTLGQVTFMNRIAEELTGWTPADAAGTPLAAVFKIINEQTRCPVESPVDKVLRLGVIVGLANHTLLIRRDGSEIPIDDSGAPIREPDGTLRGVVLIFRDFSDHKESERRLRRAKAEVEAASRAKDHFLATLSHELRTPLTPVLATLDSWDAAGEVPPALAADVQIIRRNIALEARLIDDLLDLTRIVRGKLPLNLDELDVHELVEAVAAMCRADADAKRIELSLRLQAERHYARADPARLQQVFWNVLKNAIKFTPEGGHIMVVTADAPARGGLNTPAPPLVSRSNEPAVSSPAVSSPAVSLSNPSSSSNGPALSSSNGPALSSSNGAGSGIRVTFTDDGIGMTEQTIARIFRPFEQATEEIARRYGGLGLGLAISRGLIEAQGGSISAMSPGPGKGSTISVLLPSIEAPKVTAAQPRPGTLDSAAATRALSILLVEDHADTAHAMSRLLRRLGHTVQTSGTVAEAAELARNAPYDLLLSDIGLPDGTGIDLIRQVRAHRDLTAIALTGYGMEDDIARCLEAGFCAHLTKPIDFQHLERMVQQVADGGATNGKGKA